MTNQRGFTYIELMVVVAIIGILAAIAIPQFSSYRKKAFQAEGYELAAAVKANVVDFYDHTGRLPHDNTQAGVALPEQLRGKYVARITVETGKIRVEFQASPYGGDPMAEPLTLIPQINAANPTGPLVWEVEKS